MTKKKRQTLDKHSIDQDVYSLALERVRHAYSLFDHIAVSFSGGKDSTAVLNVTLEVARELGRLPLDVIFFDEEAVSQETIDYVRRVSQDPDVNLRWYCLPVQHRNACSRQSPYWYPWAPEDKDKWVRELPPEAITHLNGFKRGYTIPDSNGLLFDPQKHGTVGLLLGIRAQESMTRHQAVTRRREENYIIQYTGKTDRGGLYKVYPIYDWKTEDVWTAPKLFGWDYNHSYDIMDKAGITPYQQRVAPPFGEQPLQSLWMWSVCFPDLWDKLCQRVPGVTAAVRYSKTMLYGFRKRPEKPDDVSWEDYLLHFIRKHHSEVQKIIVKRIRQEIESHYRKTSDPILAKARHPISGISWDYLLFIAMRGDTKNRSQRRMGVSESVEKNYQKELAEWKREHDKKATIK